MKNHIVLRNGFTLVELLVVIAIIGILIGMLLPAVQRVREAARRTQCLNNQKQVAIAMFSYESSHENLPYGSLGADDGSWVVWLMPFIEQGNLRARYDSREPYHHRVNQDAVTTIIPTYQCPTDEPQSILGGGNYHGIRKMNYAVNLGNTGWPSEVMMNGRMRIGAPIPVVPDPYGTGTIEYQGAPFTMEGNLDDRNQFGLNTITDGTSNTLMLSEVIQGVAAPSSTWDLRGLAYWGYGSGFSTMILPNAELPDRIQYNGYFANESPNPPGALHDADNPIMMGARSKHLGGVAAACCDGSIHFISDRVDLAVWRAMSTSRGGEVDSID